MNFGNNLLTWFQDNAQALVYFGIMVIGLFLLAKRETSKFLGFLLIALAAVLLVFNPSGVTGLLLKLGNRIFSIGSIGISTFGRIGMG